MGAKEKKRQRHESSATLSRTAEVEEDSFYATMSLGWIIIPRITKFKSKWSSVQPLLGGHGYDVFVQIGYAQMDDEN